jgi:hypothetical protein
MAGDVLRSIHRLEDLPRLAAALGYTPAWRELPDNCFRGITTAAIVARQGEFEWYGVGGPAPGAARVARALLARGIPAAVLGLEEQQRKLVVAAADAPPLELSLDLPDQLDLARLLRCSARPGELALAAAFRIAEALAGRGVDERFFTEFRKTLESVMAALPPRMPLADRHALALLQLTRILFLYFIEAKGWLGGPRFLSEAVDRCLSERRSLHRDLLNPLFFGTLNRPFAARSKLARRFGAVPFLNGGLFEPHALERRWPVTLPTPVLRHAFDSLFERFHFTLSAASGEAIAPDMLGRVFEGVMEPGERHATGSYYTPAALVEAMLRDALAVWLERRARLTGPEARRRLDDPDLETRRMLREIKLLDPAVGSGAFLLGALRLMAGPDRAPGIRRRADTAGRQSGRPGVRVAFASTGQSSGSGAGPAAGSGSSGDGGGEASCRDGARGRGAPPRGSGPARRPAIHRHGNFGAAGGGTERDAFWRAARVTWQRSPSAARIAPAAAPRQGAPPRAPPNRRSPLVQLSHSLRGRLGPGGLRSGGR